jgi:hypothetical protein
MKSSLWLAKKCTSPLSDVRRAAHHNEWMTMRLSFIMKMFFFGNLKGMFLLRARNEFNPEHD